MNKKFSKTISDVHDETGIPRNGSGQRLIRDPIREGRVGIEGEDWIKSGSYALTEDFFNRLVVYLKNNS